MKVVILAPNPPDCVSFGPRQLASVLREQGIACSVVFLRGSVKNNRFDGSYVYQYADTVIDDILSICADADVVGVSFMSLYWDRAVQLTEAVQSRLGKKVIWGGTHPTLRPEESLEVADYVCVGEGEIAFLEWLRRVETGSDLTDVNGIWAREQTGEHHENGEAPEVPDIEALPWPDMDTEGHWVDSGDRVVPMTTEMMRRVLPRLPWWGGEQRIGVRVMATRGCPHRCTYCASSAQNTMRRRSVESTIDHLKWLKGRYPFIDVIYEFDDTFFANKRSWLRDFSTQYKAEIGLPWFCQTSPSTLKRDKLDMLIESGLVYCEMGVQSGSPEIKKLFQRWETDEQVRDAARLLQEYHADGKLLRPRYHVITDVPWESSESVLRTVETLLALPQPFELAIGSLCLFPGTALNDRAWADGLLTDELTQVYRKPFLRPEPNLLNWLIYASQMQWVPRHLLHRLADVDVLDRLDGDKGARVTRLSRALHLGTNLLDRVPRAFDAVRNRDVDRIRQRFAQPT